MRRLGPEDSRRLVQVGRDVDRCCPIQEKTATNDLSLRRVQLVSILH